MLRSCQVLGTPKHRLLPPFLRHPGAPNCSRQLRARSAPELKPATCQLCTLHKLTTLGAYPATASLRSYYRARQQQSRSFASHALWSADEANRTHFCGGCQYVLSRHTDRQLPRPRRFAAFAVAGVVIYQCCVAHDPSNQRPEQKFGLRSDWGRCMSRGTFARLCSMTVCP